MIVVTDFEQNSPEWFAARAGIPSASCFDKIVTSRGEPSKQARNYLLQLAGEAVIGDKAETFQGWTMQRGIEMEAEARSFYEFATGHDVQSVGLVYSDDRTVCCSPDGLVGEGGLEIKCPILHTAVGYWLNGGLPTDYVQQVQGSLWITGAPWWDFMSYYPGMRPLIVRVEPDLAFHKKLDEHVPAFLAELDKVKAQLMERMGI